MVTLKKLGQDKSKTGFLYKVDNSLYEQYSFTKKNKKVNSNERDSV